MNKRKHIILAFVFAFSILVVLPSFYVSVRSSDPEFCLSCHFEKPYYDSWKASSHGETACIECHPNLRYKMPWITFRYMIGLYSMRPHASVETNTCLNCHNKDKLFAETLKIVDKKSFNHSQHLSKPLRGVQLRCSSCHSHIVQGSHNTVEETVCFTCHFMGASPSDSITGCTSCHGTPKETVTRHGFSFDHTKYLKLGVSCGECHVKITEGTGEIVSGACHKCHVEPEGTISKDKVHDIHVTKSGVDCFECHKNIRHGNLQMVKTFDVSCQKCHENLHSAQKSLYMGVGGEGIGDYPSRMFAAQVTCDGCHTESVEKRNAFVTETTKRPQAKACVTCHQPGFDTMLQDWKHSFASMLSYVNTRISSASLKSKTTESRHILEMAHHNYDLVKFGKPAHNVEYGVKLMKFTLDQLDKVSPEPVRQRPKPLQAPDAYCATLCHNRLGMPEDLLFHDTIDFPHKKHVEKVGPACGRCHSVEHHGETKLTLAQCNTCHHQQLKDVEDRCTTCHVNVNQFFNGKLKGFESGDPNPMLDMATCTDCHDVTTGEAVSVKTVRQTCIDCHDEDYGGMLDDWIATGVSHRDDLAAKIKELETRSEGHIALPKSDARIVEQEFRKLKSASAIFQKNVYVHNPDYADTIYADAIKSYNTIKTKLK